jgi:uncharacterized membrane protein
MGPTLVIAAVFLLVAIVFVADTSWYAAFKTLHVVFAVIWVGGGLLFNVLGARAERMGDPDEMLAVVRQAGAVSEKLFIPSSLIVLVFGIAMMFTGPGEFWEWSSFWILFALAGFAATFLLGVAVLTPQVKKLQGLMETAGPKAPETQAAISRLFLIARADAAILMLVVVDMTAKPFL